MLTRQPLAGGNRLEKSRTWELAVLESVEDLLERELHARQNNAMTPGESIRAGGTPGERKNGSARRDDKRKVRDDQSEAEESTGDSAEPHECAAESNAPAAALMDVRVEPDDYTMCIDRKYGRGYLLCIDEVKASAAQIHGAPQFAEQPALRLPGYAIRKSTLNLQAFLALHPGIDQGEHIAGHSRDRSRRRCESGARDLRDEPSLFWNGDAGSFFRESLIKAAGAQPDLIRYVAELSLANEIGRVRHRAGSLQLRGPGENALEGLSIE
jgi:hypothetical protein